MQTSKASPKKKPAVAQKKKSVTKKVTKKAPKKVPKKKVVEPSTEEEHTVEGKATMDMDMPEKEVAAPSTPLETADAPANASIVTE